MFKIRQATTSKAMWKKKINEAQPICTPPINQYRIKGENVRFKNKTGELSETELRT